jgi:hypothetical protein
MRINKVKFKTAVKAVAPNQYTKVAPTEIDNLNITDAHSSSISTDEIPRFSKAKSEGKESPPLPTLNEDSSAQIKAEVINHSWLLVFIALLFLAAVGVATADDWASSQTSLYIPPFVVPTLKYIEGGLFISGILFAAIYGIKTFRHVLMKGIQELTEIYVLLIKFCTFIKKLFH